jgi:hypothetical protein
LFRHACPALVVLAVFLVTLVDSWLFTDGGRGSGGVDDVVLSIVSSIFPDGQIKILDLSVSFIVVGVGVPWLVRHVKARRRQQRQQVESQVGLSFSFCFGVVGCDECGD